MKKGQVSAEMIVLIAAVLAVALIFAAQLQKTASDGSKNLQANANKAFVQANCTADKSTGGGGCAGEACGGTKKCGEGFDCKQGKCVYET